MGSDSQENPGEFCVQDVVKNSFSEFEKFANEKSEKEWELGTILLAEIMDFVLYNYLKINGQSIIDKAAKFKPENTIDSILPLIDLHYVNLQNARKLNYGTNILLSFFKEYFKYMRFMEKKKESTC